MTTARPVLPALDTAQCTLDPLPMARFHLCVQAEASLELPSYAGSMLRGAFGHALESLALLSHDHNEPCALQASCPYCQLFLTPAATRHRLQKFSHFPAPYIIEPPAIGQRSLRKGDSFTFSLVLIALGLEKLPLVIAAFERAFERGLTRSHRPCKLTMVRQEHGNIIWQPGQGDASNALPPPFSVAPASRRAVLTFHTPLRLQKRGKPARAGQLDARALLIALARRWQLLADVHLGAAAPQLDFRHLAQAAEAIQLVPGSLQWFDWGRYSTRQKRSMKFGGLIGDLQLTGDLTPFRDLLHVGQWLHVGKETTFGLGRYTIRWE